MVRFKHYNCDVEFAHYFNKRTAIQLVDSDESFIVTPIAVATVNVPDVELGPNEVIIKDYSENEGVLDALIEAGYISEPLRFIETGFVQCPVCELLKFE